MSETSPLLAGSSRGPPPAYSSQATDEYRVAHTPRIRAYTRIIRLDSPSPVSDNAASPVLFSSKVALRRTVLVLAILLVFMLTSTILLAVDRFRDIPNSEARAHIRREWHREELAHDKQHRWWDIERDQWEQDRRRWEIEKARHEAEDRRWEKERLRRMRLYWGPLWRNDHCHSYGTREYTARLWNIAPGADGLAVCMQMPMTINNILILPSECEDRVSCHRLQCVHWMDRDLTTLQGSDGIHGRWLVDYGEVTCQPYWDTLNDKVSTLHPLKYIIFKLHRFRAVSIIDLDFT